VKADKAMMAALLEENRKSRKRIQEIESEILDNEEAIKREVAIELDIDWMGIEITYCHECDDPENKNGCPRFIRKNSRTVGSLKRFHL
jgi:hypothetical protein